MAETSLRAVEKVIGYRFHEPGLLSQALTHSSRKSDLHCSNERLEFLGDAVLGAVVSEFLYRTLPDYTEGDLTRVKSEVVSRVTLARVARGMGLGDHLMVAKGLARPAGCGEAKGRTSQRHRRLPPSLLANAFEAIVAAIYLDGGLEPAREFVLRFLQQVIEGCLKAPQARNFKSLLQQLVQRRMGTVPEYRLVAESGPDHGKSFEVVVTVGGRRYGTGRGRTKKAAEQRAAAATLAMLGGAKGPAGDGSTP